MYDVCINNLAKIKNEIKSLFEYYFLKPKETCIIAVSKNRSAEQIQPLLQTNHRIFGENKVQEAIDKWVDLKKQYPDIQLHLIGALQSNKVKKALQIFDVIQTIDRHSLIDEIIKYPELIENKSFFIQVNTGSEPQKSGVLISEFDALLAYCQQKNLPISGLMCIPPKDANATHHFTILQSLARKNGHLKISAGMSADYAKAIIVGTDYVRIGSKIFEPKSFN